MVGVITTRLLLPAVLLFFSAPAVCADSGALNFFPVALYSANIPNMERVASLGFNAVVGDADTEFIKTADRHGLKVIANSFFQGRPGDTDRVLTARSFSNVIAQVVVDEPDIYGKNEDDVKRWARQTRHLDPHRPVYITTWSPGNYGKFKPSADIFSVTPYPIHAENYRDTGVNLGFVYAAVRAAMSTAPTQLPVWATIQCFAGLPTWPRHPRPDEIRSMVYQALAAGAEGILYYAMSSGEPYAMSDGSRNWNLFSAQEIVGEVTLLNDEVRKLSAGIAVSGAMDQLNASGPVVIRRIDTDTQSLIILANTGSDTRTVLSFPWTLPIALVNGRGLRATIEENVLRVVCDAYCGGSISGRRKH